MISVTIRAMCAYGYYSADTAQYIAFVGLELCKDIYFILFSSVVWLLKARLTIARTLMNTGTENRLPELARIYFKVVFLFELVMTCFGMPILYFILIVLLQGIGQTFLKFQMVTDFETPTDLTDIIAYVLWVASIFKFVALAWIFGSTVSEVKLMFHRK